MPHLSDLWSGISSQRHDVVFLSVNRGDPADVIADWWARDGFRHRAVRQEGDEVSSAFGVRLYPTNVVVGADGRIIYYGTGWDEAAVREALVSTAR
jgi:hypothetical protein